MTKNRNVSDLGIYVSMLILNNKIFERGLITEPMKNKMSALIQSEYLLGRYNENVYKIRPPKEVM